MFYLRKEPFEQVIPEIIKTDGTKIPERKYTTEDRAIYKHIRFSRFYRQTYNESDTELRLYKVKKMSTILITRKLMHRYCGEWFDVYDENGIVDISGYVYLSELKPGTLLDCNNTVMPVEKVTELIKSGKKGLKLFTITDEYVEEILRKAYREYIKKQQSGVLTAPNNGKRVIIDIAA